MTSPESRSEDRQTQTRSSWLRTLAPPLLIFGLVSGLVIAHVAAYRPLSMFDEGTHFDYVIKLSRGEMLNRGEKLGQAAMREIACRKVDIEGILYPPCDSLRFDPAAFPLSGFSTAEIHPPVYYGITAVIARGLVTTGIAPDMFAAARLVGILWLGLGLVVIWYLGKELRIATVPLAGVITAVAAVPPLLHSSATVTNDAVGLVAGGMVGLVTLRWEKGASPLWLLGVVTFLALALKTTNGVAVGVCVLYLLLRSRAAAGSSQERGNVRAGVATLLIAAALSLFAWVVVHALLATPVSVPVMGTGDLRFLDVLSNLTTLATPVSYGLPSTVLGREEFLPLAGLLAVLMGVATLYPLVRGSLKERWERLGGSTGLIMLFGGGLFALASFALYGNVTVSPRYGLSLTPFLAVSAAAAIRTRAVVWFLWAIAVGQLVLVLRALLRA